MTDRAKRGACSAGSGILSRITRDALPHSLWASEFTARHHPVTTGFVCGVENHSGMGKPKPHRFESRIPSYSEKNTSDGALCALVYRRSLSPHTKAQPRAPAKSANLARRDSTVRRSRDSSTALYKRMRLRADHGGRRGGTLLRTDSSHFTVELREGCWKGNERKALLLTDLEPCSNPR